MSYTTILLEVKEHIGIITLNRPDRNNTFNVPMAKELNKALLEFDEDPQVRVVIIKGAGKNFCTGIDLNDFSGKNNLEYYNWVELMEKMNLTMIRMAKPVIASVHKTAVANGISIVAAADLAIAAENARFGATAVNVGLFCMGPAVPLARCIGRKKALELLLTGNLIDAWEAERIGLVNKVVPNDQLEDATIELAHVLAGKSPLALQLGKKSFYKMIDLEYSAALDLTNNHFATLCTTADAHEGVDAFLSKRKPQWKYR